MFPVIQTNKYLLSEFLPGDQQFVFSALSHPEVIPYYGVSYTSFDETLAQMEFYSGIWKLQTGCWWKITALETSEPIGACGINNYLPAHEKAEVGYWLVPAAWKKGVMREVLPAMLHHVFSNWKVNRLEAVIERGNTASARLVEKLGFRFEGELRESEIKNGKRITLLMYSMLRSDRF